MPGGRDRALPLLLSTLALAACGERGSGRGQIADGPPPSAGHELVWHEALGLVVLVNAGLGGSTVPPPGEATRLWSWDGVRWSLLDDGGPPVRNLGGVAYDARRQVIVLHGGGYDLANLYGDTWEWSHPGGWRRIDVPGPGPCDHTQMAYDRTRERVVLFGGQSDPDSFLTETWTWDGAAWEASPAQPGGPSPRVHHALAYDPDAGAVIVFGGIDPDGSERGDTWAFDGAAWVELPAASAPRTHARMAHDAAAGALVAVGGPGPGAPILARTATGWAPLVAAGALPPPRYLPGVAYDARRGVLVVFGGGDPASDELMADTWELAGDAWSRR